MTRFFCMGLILVSMSAQAGPVRAAAVPPPSAALRLAVIGTADTADLAALVTTELSTNPNISLLERNDLAKVGDELKLQQLAGADSVALGKLVRADGLVFIDKSSNRIRFRFTAVGLGYALFDDQIPGDQDPAKVAKSIAHRVTGYAPKLKLDPTKTIPISVLNLRADYGTAESQKLERNLTLLLESRLTSVPEYVVLERRHAWSLGFERTLDPGARPILRGAYWIEGTLSLTSNSSGKCTIAMRIHFPDKRQHDTTCQGSVENLPLLVDQILAEIQKSIGGTIPSVRSEAAREAQEYLREGLWGRRAHSLDAGLEALDSAELLGAKIADVAAVRIPILYAMADEGMENWMSLFDSEDKIPSFDGPGLARRAEAAIRALHEAARYKSEKMEAQVDPALLADSTEKFLASTDNLVPWTVYRASKVLYLLDRANSPRADELRQALRPVTEYDPLHGHAGRAFPTNANNDNSRAQFADNWAQSLEEELAYYRLACADNDMSHPFTQIGWNLDRFCERFYKTPAERHKAFADFVDSLRNRPDSRISYCLLRTHSEDAAIADAGYKDFIGELWKIRDELASAHSDRPLFQNLYRLPKNVIIRNSATARPLLHYLLTSPNIDSWSIGVLRTFWQPQGFSESEAPQLWIEYKNCRDRLGAWWKAAGYGEGGWNEQMGGMADDFREKFPKLAEVPPVAELEADALVVTKFWQPGQVASSPQHKYQISSMKVGPDGVWLTGLFIFGERYPVGIFHVNLESFTTKAIPYPGKLYPSDLAITPQAIYFLCRPDSASSKHELARFDLKSSSWQVRGLPDFQSAQLFGVEDNLYLFVTLGASFLEGTSIVRYDWDADKWNILASNRRRPAHNQFDDAAPMMFGRIFAGPNHQPCLNLYQGTYFIREDEGAWPEVFPGTWGHDYHSIGDRTLLCQGSEAVMLDANATAPKYWVANSHPRFRKDGVNGISQEKVPTPWAKQAHWTFPTHEDQSPWQMGVGFHDDTLFILEKPKPGGIFHLLCYQKGNNTPIHIPLQFHMDDTTRAQLSFVPDTGSHPVEHSIDHLQHPEKVTMERIHIYPTLVSTHQGLCLQYFSNGFWFLPFTDIDNYLKAHPLK